MMTRKKPLSALLFFSMTFAILSLSGKEALAGGFTNSCLGLSLDSELVGFVLSSSCRDISGRFRPTSLVLDNNIGNVDGRLQTNSRDFSDSCQVAGLRGAVLEARCLSREGVLIPTSLDLNRVISNVDGRLKFD